MKYLNVFEEYSLVGFFRPIFNLENQMKKIKSNRISNITKYDFGYKMNVIVRNKPKCIGDITIDFNYSDLKKTNKIYFILQINLLNIMDRIPGCGIDSDFRFLDNNISKYVKTDKQIAYSSDVNVLNIINDLIDTIDLDGFEDQIEVYNRQVEIGNIKAAERNKEYEIRINKRKLLQDHLDEVSDYFSEFETMGKLISKFGTSLVYDIKGIEVIKQDFSDRSRSVTNTFDEAKLVMNDELLEVMRVIRTAKKRMSEDYNDVEMQVFFKNDTVTINFNY